MSALLLSGLASPDSDALRTLSRQVTTAGDDLEHHESRVSSSVASAPGEVVANAVGAATAMADRWSKVASSLTDLAAAATDMASTLNTLATSVDSADASWRGALSEASGHGFTLTAVGGTAEVDAPALPASASASDQSTQQSQVEQVRSSGQSAIDALDDAVSTAQRHLHGIALPNLDGLGGQASVDIPSTGNAALDAEISRLAHPILSVPSHFNRD